VKHRLPSSGDVFAVRGVVSPLVGRDAELGQLQALYEKAIQFHAPQFVTVMGNQGTGKTRLISEFLSKVPGGARVVRGAAVAGHRYSVIASALRDRVGLADGDDSEQAKTRFRELIQQVFGDRRVGEVLHFLGAYVGFRFADSPFLRAFEHDARHSEDIGRAVLRRFLEVDSESSPLVIHLDDLEDADDDSLQLLHELAEGLSGCAVMVVCGARPELLARRPTWGQGSGETSRLELRNLDPASAARLLRNLLARCADVPADLIEDAVGMTSGNPFFLGELVRVFTVNGTIDASGPVWRLDPVKAAETELPISVEEAIEARIAALDAGEVDLLEKGAIFGSVFWVSSVVALARTDHAREKRALPATPGQGWVEDGLKGEYLRRIQALAERDYVLALPEGDSTIPGDVEVVFKHNLERDLVWKLLPGEKRTRYYRVAAQWLEIKLTERSEEQLDFLAQLYHGGGDLRRAALALQAAGDKARLRYANAHAVDFYKRALALFEPDDVLLRMETLHHLGSVLSLVGRTDEALAQFQEMLHVAWLFDHPAKGGAAHGRLGRIYRQKGDYARALDHFTTAHELFDRADDLRGLAGALDDMGMVHWLRGDYDLALDHHRRALELRQRIGDRRSIALSLANIGRVHHDQGRFDEAMGRFREALEIRRAIGDREGTVSSLCDLGTVLEADGKLDHAYDTFVEAVKLAKETGDKLEQARVLGRMGEVELAQGKTAAALDHLSAAAELLAALGDRLGQSDCARRLAEAYLVLGDKPKALEQAQRAVDLAGRVGSRVHLGSAQRVLAEVYGGDPANAARAEETFASAIAGLKEVHHELELARCYRSFAAFREKTGHPADAVQLRLAADEIFGRLRGAARART
jgi:tetratricopeptide (TPR) repeat protein